MDGSCSAAARCSHSPSSKEASFGEIFFSSNSNCFALASNRDLTGFSVVSLVTNPLVMVQPISLRSHGVVYEIPVCTRLRNPLDPFRLVSSCLPSFLSSPTPQSTSSILTLSTRLDSLQPRTPFHPLLLRNAFSRSHRERSGSPLRCRYQRCRSSRQQPYPSPSWTIQLAQTSTSTSNFTQPSRNRFSPSSSSRLDLCQPRLQLGGHHSTHQPTTRDQRRSCDRGDRVGKERS